jgi:hypothetical protein
MARINLYGQNQHTVIWDGLPISGFMEGDFMEVECDGNEASRTLGGDGPSMNISTAQGGQVSITLMPTSPAIGPLYALREQQRSNPRLFSIVLVTGVQEVINAAGCAYAKLPKFSTGGPKMQGRQFIAECLEVSMDPTITSGASGGLLGGLL